MAPVVSTSNSIIDLTGEDEGDDTTAGTHAGFQEAIAAFSRLRRKCESLNPLKPVAYHNPNVDATLSEKNPLPTSVPQPLSPPRLGASPKPARSETDGLRKDEKNNATPRPNNSIPSPHSSAPLSALGAAASKPVRPPSNSGRPVGNNEQPNVSIVPVISKTDTFPIRMPRSAAISAKQNITEACSELEAWRQTNLDHMTEQAGPSRPRKPGKRSDDLDEWSPDSNTNYTEEEGKGLTGISINSPTLSANKDEVLTVKGESSLSLTQGMFISLGTKKRKFSGSSQFRTSPVKVARLDGEPAVHRYSTPPISAEPANRKRILDGSETGSPAGIFPRCVYPALKTAKGEYKERLPEDDLTRIEKSVSLTMQKYKAI